MISQWPQYHNLQEGDICISIEHCGNCECHASISHHNPDHYKTVRNIKVKEILNFNISDFIF